MDSSICDPLSMCILRNTLKGKTPARLHNNVWFGLHLSLIVLNTNSIHVTRHSFVVQCMYILIPMYIRKIKYV